MKPVCLDTGVEQDFSQLFLELLANGITQLLPFFQGA